MYRQSEGGATIDAPYTSTHDWCKMKIPASGRSARCVRMASFADLAKMTCQVHALRAGTRMLAYALPRSSASSATRNNQNTRLRSLDGHEYKIHMQRSLFSCFSISGCLPAHGIRSMVGTVLRRSPLSSRISPSFSRKGYTQGPTDCAGVDELGLEIHKPTKNQDVDFIATIVDPLEHAVPTHIVRLTVQVREQLQRIQAQDTLHSCFTLRLNCSSTYNSCVCVCAAHHVLHRA